MCLHVCGSGFSANTTAIIGPDAQLLSSFHTLSVSLSLSLMYHLSRFTKNANYLTRQHSPVTHVLTVFQERRSTTSWFWSNSSCLTGLLGETQRKSKRDTDGANLISGQFSNFASNLSLAWDCRSSWINSQKQEQAVWGVADSQIPLLTWDKTETRLSQAAGHNPTF